jgi:hypothetical protein
LIPLYDVQTKNANLIPLYPEGLSALALQKQHAEVTRDDGKLSEDDLREKIHPVPVLFTDRFRSLLQTAAVP